MHRVTICKIAACFGAAALATLASGCEAVPRDADGWTDRIVRTGVLTVGTSPKANAEPDAEKTEMEARERRAVEALARRLNARVEWREGNVHELLTALEQRELPVVAATVSGDTPFQQKVGLSQPYVKKGPHGKPYCIAVAPGENRLLLLLDQTIAAQQREEGGAR